MQMSAKDLFSEYLNTFDPDYVVPLGSVNEPPFDVGDRRVLSKPQVLGERGESEFPTYGIGIFNLLDHFVKNELEYNRRTPLQIILPEPYKFDHLFFGAVIGSLPERTVSVLRHYWTDILGAKWEHIDGKSYAKLLVQNSLYPHNLSSHYIKDLGISRSFNESYVFVLDPKHLSDLIDFWNLRAAGCHVLPLTVDIARDPASVEIVQKFVEAQLDQCDINRQQKISTKIMGSRHVSKQHLDRLKDTLDVSISIPGNNMDIQVEAAHLPIWNSAKHLFFLDSLGKLVADIRDVDISDQDVDLRFKTLDPPFTPRVRIHFKPSFANVIDLRLYGRSKFLAEVIPEAGRDLVRALGGATNRDYEWRCSPSGITLLSIGEPWPIRLEIPDAETVFVGWLQQQGWSVNVSPPGRIAMQIFQALGGSRGMHILTNRGILDLLEYMSKKKWLKKKDLFSRLSQVLNQSQDSLDIGDMVEKLVSHGVIKLGVDVQCPVCIQHSWYSVTELSYTLHCAKCSSDFTIPSHSPDRLVWSYRSSGPFSLAGYAIGSYTVLLTHNLFSSNLYASTTALMSANMKRGKVNIETDLALLVRERIPGRSPVWLVFVECKSYGRFEQQDLDRMSQIGSYFPSSILVFSTLRTEFSTNEKGLLRRLVRHHRKHSGQRSEVNPIMVLTALELCSNQDPLDSWRSAGGNFASFADDLVGYRGILEFCSWTQMLHLDMALKTSI